VLLPLDIHRLQYNLLILTYKPTPFCSSRRSSWSRRRRRHWPRRWRSRWRSRCQRSGCSSRPARLLFLSYLLPLHRTWGELLNGLGSSHAAKTARASSQKARIEHNLNFAKFIRFTNIGPLHPNASLYYSESSGWPAHQHHPDFSVSLERLLPNLGRVGVWGCENSAVFYFEPDAVRANLPLVFMAPECVPERVSLRRRDPGQLWTSVEP